MARTSSTVTEQPNLKEEVIWTPLVYSLPLDHSPIPWPAVPNYPVALRSRRLQEAYQIVLWETERELNQASSSNIKGDVGFNTLSNTAREKQRCTPAQEVLNALEQFARLLTSQIDQLDVTSFNASLPNEEPLQSEIRPNSAVNLVQEIERMVLPIKRFDRKWRTVIPDVISSVSKSQTLDESKVGMDSGDNKPKKGKRWALDEIERQLVVHAYNHWIVGKKTNESVKPEDLVMSSNHKETITGGSSTHVNVSKDEKDAAQPLMPSLDTCYGPERVENEPAELFPEATTSSMAFPSSDKSAEKKSESQNESSSESWTVQDESLHEWFTDLELIDTQLQVILALGLLSISYLTAPYTRVTPSNDVATSTKKYQDAHGLSTSLDPELLLDHLTDRLQIWRVMKDLKVLNEKPATLGRKSSVGGLGEENLAAPTLASDSNIVESAHQDKPASVADRDQVELWWDDVIQLLFSHRVPSRILSQHYQKLFSNPDGPIAAERESYNTNTSNNILHNAAASQVDPLDRSLWSLHKSATKRKRQAEKDRLDVMESPTMKKLLGVNKRMKLPPKDKVYSLEAAFLQAKQDSATSQEAVAEDIFKVPEVSKRKTPTDLLEESSIGCAGSSNMGGVNLPPPKAACQPQPPRKQERPRPLPRGDALGGSVSSKRLFKREVSLPARASSVEARRRKSGSSFLHQAEMVRAGDTQRVVTSTLNVQSGRPRLSKRKSVSPKKLKPAEQAASFYTTSTDLHTADWTESTSTGSAAGTKILAPDTPMKCHSSTVLNRKAFGRAGSMPLFAALGAAFRPGTANDDDGGLFMECFPSMMKKHPPAALATTREPSLPFARYTAATASQKS